MESLGEQPLFSTFLFRGDFGQPYGPLSSDEELWAAWEPVLRELPEKARLRLRERMPSAEPYTFTHSDLNTGNIIVKDRNLAGIIDWESSGYFPVWWEFARAGIGLGKHDGEWKTLLRKHMFQYEEGREFWLDLYALSAYPKLNERGAKVLAQLLCD
jgi:aminoglycoside phosphotransferase (APT) family kinase protein